jgi:signal transduction histidine kinase
LKSALDGAGLRVDDPVLAQMARVLTPSELPAELWVSAMSALAGSPWPDMLARLVRFAVALQTQEALARNLGAFSRAVTEAVGVGEWETVKRRRADLNKLVGAAVGALRTRAEQEAMPLEAEVRQGDVLVALLALLDNAIDAASSARVGARVHVATMRDGSDAVVAISNNGDRVPKDKEPLLGREPFTTKPKGTGVGLIIAWDLVRANVGEIRHAYDPATGTTTFTTRLPLV